MKWIRRLVTGKGRTPTPPKPYVDTANVGKEMTDPRTVKGDLMPHLDPEKPHWKDPRFESREKVPYFDIFGFNRDWSWTMFKLFGLVFIVVQYQELKMYTGLQHDTLRMQGTAIQPTPQYAKNEKATENELREAGYAYVGTKALDNIGAAAEEKRARAV